ncbi:mitochondrial 2-oxodicarboxylate carrier [Cimex lectularius]|uniref:Mitochondrial 2-oxodicarboxylate carrier n=1 Tax=Cimex lectularius TaxID=79782 RepID=A0A8I6TE29_CIMLE|nr:mitochondrial 2-oxodicarboxylate carrier [Cimex lectularius]
MDVKKFLKDAAIQIGSGGSAGFVEVCIMHPLDVVKTRLQLQNQIKKGSPHHYTGIVDCLGKMRQHEGVFAFWKGIIPPILAETPKRAVKFVSFEQYKKIFLFGSPTPTPLTFSLAGVFAGMTEAFFVNPFEVVKVTMQSDKTHMKELPSTWTTTRRIIVTQGFGGKGLYRGITATILRNMVFNGIYFGFYHSMKGKLSGVKDPRLELIYKLGLGFVSGVLGSCFNIPFDVAKSRIQGPQPTPGQIKYASTVDTMMIIYKEEGWRALYKGLVPKVMRLGPGGAIMLVVYEHVHSYLTTIYNT